MKDVTRRNAIQLAAGAGLTAIGVETEAQDAKDEKKPMTDRDFVMAAGMTAEEAACWAVTAEAAGKFFALPELHPMDRQEVASAIHIIQNKLLSRPTYRKYLETAKKAQNKGQE
jgi:hypothetical protein